MINEKLPIECPVHPMDRKWAAYSKYRPFPICMPNFTLRACVRSDEEDFAICFSRK